ncbi:MAG: hypothetical protein ACI955_000413 [Zhongshania sp.]|jgi:hypothetical protein
MDRNTATRTAVEKPRFLKINISISAGLIRGVNEVFGFSLASFSNASTARKPSIKSAIYNYKVTH